MLPSVAKSGWIPAGFINDGPFGIALLAPEHLFGLTGLDNLTHSLFWSLLVNVALYVGLSLAARPRRARPARRSSSSTSSAAAGAAARSSGAAAPGSTTCARWPAASSAPRARSGSSRSTRARAASRSRDLAADARLVDRVERQLAGAIGSASARVMVASVAEEEPLGSTT